MKRIKQFFQEQAYKFLIKTQYVPKEDSNYVVIHKDQFRVVKQNEMMNFVLNDLADWNDPLERQEILQREEVLKVFQTVIVNADRIDTRRIQEQLNKYISGVIANRKRLS